MAGNHLGENSADRFDTQWPLARREAETPPVTIKQRLGRWVIPRLPGSRFLFELIRVEINAIRVKIANAISPRRRRRIAALREERDLLVNVACGPQATAGFISIDLFPTHADVIQWDCRWSLPLADEAARGIRAEHFVEHLEPREELPSFLRDCFRCLKPGGVLRIVVPDAERYLRAYVDGDFAGFQKLGLGSEFPPDLPTRMDVVNHVFHQWHEHRWAYDFETLSHRLGAVGFQRVVRASYRDSLEPLLAGDREEHQSYSLYVDAVKPS